MQAFWNGLLSLFSNTLKSVCRGWDVVRRGGMDSLLEDPEGRTPLHLKAVNDACRSLRNQWTAATMFLRLNVRVCACVYV